MTPANLLNIWSHYHIEIWFSRHFMILREATVSHYYKEIWSNQIFLQGFFFFFFRVWKLQFNKKHMFDDYQKKKKIHVFDKINDKMYSTCLILIPLKSPSPLSLFIWHQICFDWTCSSWVISNIGKFLSAPLGIPHYHFHKLPESDLVCHSP